MAKKRYSFAFFITVFLYLSIGVFFLSQENITSLQKNTPRDNSPISFSIIEPKKAIPQPKVEEKVIEKKVVEKKIVQEKIVKKEPKVVKKIVKKTTPEPEPKKIVQKTTKPIEENTTLTKTVDIPIVTPKTTIKKPQQLVNIDKEVLKAKQNQYYETIKQTIDKNKSYPKVALRRGIQGEVKIQFTLSKTGDLLSYKIIDGDKIFQNSITKAIASSFPITPPKDIFTSNLDLKLTLLYRIY